MIDWQALGGWVLQVLATLIPVAIAMVSQNKKIAELGKENEALRRENTELKRDVGILEKELGDLRSEYTKSLRAQAGLKDRF